MIFSVAVKQTMSWFQKARGFVGRAIGCAGNVIQKVGDVGSGVLRAVGSVAGMAHPVVSALGAALAPVTDGASLAVSGMVNKGLDKLADGTAQRLANKVSNFGQRLQGIGATIKGD